MSPQFSLDLEVHDQKVKDCQTTSGRSLLNLPPAESRVPSFSSLPPVPQLPAEIQPLQSRYRGLSQQQNGATSLPFQRVHTSSVHGLHTQLSQPSRSSAALSEVPSVPVLTPPPHLTSAPFLLVYAAGQLLSAVSLHNPH